MLFAAVLFLLGLATQLAAQDQPAVISNVRVEPYPFSPNGDGVNETTRFTFTLSEPAWVSLEILYFGTVFEVGGVRLFVGVPTDSILQGGIWRKFVSDTLLKNTQGLGMLIDGVAGVNEFVWNGKAREKIFNNVIQLPDTTYIYMIRAEDKDTDDQYKSLRVTGSVGIDSKPPSISAVNTIPNPFSPDGDGINDYTSITFSLDGLPANAVVGNIGFVVVVTDPGTGARALQWNTATTTPAFRLAADTLDVPFAPISLQFIKRSSNSQNITFQVRGGRILDSGDTVSVITNPISILAGDPINAVYRDPTKFSFIDDVVNINGSTAALESYLIEVRTSSGAAKVDIFNSGNVKVAANVPLDPPFIGNGNYTSSFGGAGYADGTYSYVITAVDESGNQVERTGAITARSIPLSITGLAVDPDTLSPARADGISDAASISYTLSQDAQVTLKVYRDSTVFTTANLVKTLFSGTPQNKGVNNTVWDGKDGAQQYVSRNAERNYRIIITAFDPLTQQTSEARAPLFIDNLKPAELVLNTLPAATKQDTFSVKGRTEPGSTVNLFLNGDPAGSVTADAQSGSFTSARITMVRQGQNLIHAQAYDAVGNGPTWSDTLRVVFDNIAPMLTDTLIYVNGSAQRLAGRVLASYGPGDTVEVRLSDGSGRVSGVDLGRTSIQAATPTGADIEGRIILRPPDRLRFVPNGSNTASGSYRLTVTSYDSLGNSATYPVPFSVGAASSGPVVQTVNPALTPGLLNKAFSQPWTFSVTVTDNSGAGINPNASLLELYYAGQRIEGTTRYTAPATFVFTAGGAIATDGSRDGRYELRVVAEDNDPSSSGLDTRLSYLYDTRPPDTLSFAADSSRLRVILADYPGGSGIDLLTSGITVTTGGAVTVEYSTDGDSTLIAAFDPPLQAGLYSFNLDAADRAGNARQRTLAFFVNGPGLRPAVSPPGPPFGAAVRTVLLTQPLTMSMTVADNSGSGIAWDKCTVRLVGPDSVETGVNVAHQGNQLAFQAGRTLSSGGPDDGLWRLLVHVEDNQPATAHGDTVFTFILDNRVPDTVSVTFASDTSEIYVELADYPFVAGRLSSGLQLLAVTASVLGPGGVATPVTLSNDGVSRLTVRFTGGKPQAAGAYELSVTALDKAGNQAQLSRQFSLNVTGSVTLFPSDSSLVRGPLFRAWARIKADGQVLAPGGSSSLRVNRRGVPLTGIQAVSGDTLVFRFADTLTVDGSDDGRYDIIADLALAALGAQAQKRGIFTVDNIAPDTASIQVEMSAEGVRITASFTDHGSYPDVAGIDRAATAMLIEDPSGREIRSTGSLWLDANTLEANFSSLETAGLHRLRLTVIDRAGWSTVRRKAMVNSFGISAGQSVAFVEEVPARTSAKINFVSGNPDARITRAVLRIFNLRGDLVRRVDVSERIDPSGGAVNAEWLLQNDRGDLVLNGVFIYSWEIVYDNGRREEIRKTLAVARR